MSIYVGTSEIKNIYVGTTPVKEVYVGSTKVRPVGWTPGANTVAYYPLNSTTTVNDRSGNNHTLTKTGTATYSTNYVYMARGANYLICSDSAVSTIPSTYTACCWIKRGGNSSDKPVFGVMTNQYGTNRGYNLTDGETTGKYRIEIISGGGTKSGTYTRTDSNWHLWTIVISGGTGTFYLDDNSIATATTNNTYTGTLMFMINKLRDTTDRGGAYYSNMILENKARTATEITDYYNLTKGNYGL